MNKAQRDIRRKTRVLEPAARRTIRGYDDGWVNLAKDGSRILGEALGFDPRMYGCPNRSTLVTKTGGFEVRKEPGKSVFIRRKATGRKASSRVSGAV